MKDTDIAKIRQLLKAMVKISNTEPRNAADTVYGDLANKALALLPCPTCNDTSEICEWLDNKKGQCSYRTQCGHHSALKRFRNKPFCPWCGRRVKIIPYPDCQPPVKDCDGFEGEELCDSCSKRR